MNLYFSAWLRLNSFVMLKHFEKASVLELCLKVEPQTSDVNKLYNLEWQSLMLFLLRFFDNSFFERGNVVMDPL